MAAKTMVGTVAAAAFRVSLMPIDTAKTILQVRPSPLDLGATL